MAVESLARQVAMQAVPTRPGFICKHERGRFRLQPPNQFVEVRLAGPDRADKHGRIGALPLRVRDGNLIFVHVQPDEQRCRLRHG